MMCHVVICFLIKIIVIILHFGVKNKIRYTLNVAKLCCKTDSKNSWLLGVGQVQNSEMREKKRVREKGIERDRESARNSET